MNRCLLTVVIFFTSLSFVTPLLAAGDFGEQAADFPPGTFSDGGHYRLSDFEGKVLVLFFYEQTCPSCRGLIPQRNKVVEQFKDKPVKFIAIGPGDTIGDVMGYVRGTHLMMPSFADTLGVMQQRYGQHISLQNIYQFRVIDPAGKIVGYKMEPAEIEKALKDAKWKYRDSGYDPKLKNVVDLFEWNQYEAGVRALKPYTKSGGGETVESAKKLMDVVQNQAKQWLAEGVKVSESDPIKAYELYTRVLGIFVNDDLGKEADAAIKTLKSNKAVADEMAARKLFDGLGIAMSKSTRQQRPQVLASCANISKKYPQTPSAKRATELAKELETATAD